MEIWEVWEGYYEESHIVFSSIYEDRAKMYLEKELLVHEEARIHKNNVNDEADFNSQKVWLLFTTCVDCFDMAEKLGKDYGELREGDWSPYTTDCREYELSDSYFYNELAYIEELKGKPIDFKNNDIVVWKNDCGIGDFGFLVKFDYQEIVNYSKKHPDFRDELLSKFRFAFEEWGELHKDGIDFTQGQYDVLKGDYFHL